MIQATNELILGIDLNSDYVQVTYWHQSVREPMTLGQEEDVKHFPKGLRQDANGIWRLWDGLPKSTGGQETEEDLHQISDVFGKIERDEAISSADTVFAPEEILAFYLKACVADLRLLTENASIQAMVTVRHLTERLNQVIVDALLRCGIDRKHIYVQDYLSSFYYYTINQKKELWMQDVALLTYEKEESAGSLDSGAEQDASIAGYVLHIDHSTKPAIAQVDLIARQPMTDKVRAGRSDEDWNREKDRLFFELLKKVFERRTVSVSYLMGDYFNKSWAVRSIQFLCTRRRAYQGMNLYSKGACFAAMERAGLIPSREIIFGGRDMIDRNIGMEMCIRGKENYYPLVNAGVNWYEVHHVCEFIPRGEREIRVISRPMTPGDPTVHTMRLPGLPKRPDRATRLRMTVYFSSPSCCCIDVEDLGFGGLHRSSGQSWSREIHF
ncbi:MAG: DUF5716 family protein [Clostridiales bacterium]|nr:DUF5716 family protein [Clostridiales bacterium]